MFVPLQVLEAFKGDEAQARSAMYQQASIWRTGLDVTRPNDGQINMEDAVALPNASIVIPHVMTQFVKEGIEPMLIGTRLLTRVQFQPGLQIQFPAIGSLYAEDVAPGQSLPEFAPDMGGHVTNEIKVGKSGLALKIFDEVVRFSQYNLVAFWLRLAGQALARHKEKKIFNFISAIGTTAFDNSSLANRANSVTGRYTSGRNQDGSLNGAMTMDDVFEMYTLGLQQGFIMDTILVHPLTWLMWLRDPVLRTFQLQYGGGAWWNMWQGDPKNRNDLAAFPPLGEGTGQHVNPPSDAADAPTATAIEEWDQRLTSKPNPPSYLGLSFNIIPSPFVNFNVTNNTADVIMFNSQNLGALIVDEDPRVLEWTQPDLGLRKMQIAERYGLAILNEGQGIVVGRSIKVTRNYVADESVMPTLSISGTLTDPATSGLASPLE